MLRVLILCLATATPLHAREFSPTPVCLVTHDTGAAQVVVSYDPRAAQAYAIAVTRPEAWPGGGVFAIQFDGPRGLVISTDRQQLSDGGRTLTVRDTGFGNVLNGLEFNQTAKALLGDTAEVLPLDGAAPAIRAFRDCVEGGLA